MPSHFVSARHYVAVRPVRSGGSISHILTLILFLFVMAFASKVRAQSAPANDNLGSAQVVTGGTFSVTGSNAYATRETGEPIADGTSTIWYEWTAPANLNVTLTAGGNGNDLNLNIYQSGTTDGVGYDKLNFITNDNANASPYVSFVATANTTYVIALGATYIGQTNGTVSLACVSSPVSSTWVAPIAPSATTPVNDNLADAQVLSGSSFSVVGYNGSATREVSESPNDGSSTIWYEWTAPQNLTVTVSAQGTYNDIDLNVYQSGTKGQSAYGLLNFVTNNNAATAPSATFQAIANTTYVFVVGATYAGQANGSIVTTLTSVAGDPSWIAPTAPSTTTPVNDNLANAQVLSGSNFSVVGYNGSATREVPESPNDGSSTIWYEWTAPQNLTVTLNARGTYNDIDLNVYQSGTNGQPAYGLLNFVTNNTAAAAPSVTFQATANTTYVFAVGAAYSGQTNGSIVTTLTSVAGDPSWIAPAAPTATAPVNDNLANAQVLSGPNFSVVGYNGSATREGTEPSNDGSGTIWYEWTAPQNLTVTVSAQGSYNDIDLNVYQSGTSRQPAYGLLNFVTNNTATTAPSVTFRAIANTTYIFGVGSAYSGQTNGSIVTTLTSVAGDPSWIGPAAPMSTTPMNDNLAGAQMVSGSNFTVLGYNGSATREFSEPSGNGASTIWYKWTAPRNLMVTLAAQGTYNALNLNVYQSGTASQPVYNLLNFVTNNTGATSPSVTFAATANTTYVFSAGAANSGQTNGSILIALSSVEGDEAWVAPVPPATTTPMNDNLANAQVLSGTISSVLGYNGSATTEVSEPSNNGRNSLWYEWTAPENGAVILEARGSYNDMNLSVYQAGSASSLSYKQLNLVASDTGVAAPTVKFLAAAGVTYVFAVGATYSGETNGSVISSLAISPLQVNGFFFGPAAPPSDAPANDTFANAVICQGRASMRSATMPRRPRKSASPVRRAKTRCGIGGPLSGTARSALQPIMPISIAIGVFTGSRVNQLTIIKTDVGPAGDSGKLASVVFNAKAGTTYHFSVGSQYASPVGSVILNLIAGGVNIFSNDGRFSGFLDSSDADLIALTVLRTGAFSGKAYIKGRKVTLHGSFAPSGAYTKSVDGIGFQLYLDPSGGSDFIIGSVTLGGTTLPVYLEPELRASTPAAGSYTFLIAPDSSAGPAGYGVGLL